MQKIVFGLALLATFSPVWAEGSVSVADAAPAALVSPAVDESIEQRPIERPINKPIETPFTDALVKAFQAGESSLVISGFSRHFDRAPIYQNTKLNELNWGLGWQFDFAKSEPEQIMNWFANAGFYRDSLFTTAVYAGGGGFFKLPLESLIDTDFQIGLGFNTGLFYSPSYSSGRPFLTIFPALELSYGKYALNIVIAPRVKRIINAGVIFVQLKVPF